MTSARGSGGSSWEDCDGATHVIEHLHVLTQGNPPRLIPCPVEVIPAFLGLVVATLGSAAVCLVIGAGQFIDFHIFYGPVDLLLLVLLLLLLKVCLEHLVEFIAFLLGECLNEVPQFLMNTIHLYT